MDIQIKTADDAWDEYMAALEALGKLTNDMLDQSIKISQAAQKTLEAQKQVLLNR